MFQFWKFWHRHNTITNSSLKRKRHGIYFQRMSCYNTLCHGISCHEIRRERTPRTREIRRRDVTCHDILLWHGNLHCKICHGVLCCDIVMSQTFMSSTCVVTCNTFEVNSNNWNFLNTLLNLNNWSSYFEWMCC